MLLGQKKSQREEHNWSIILNPLRSEIDKRRVSRKISEAFSLSVEEAFDLVSNTPIILLDNLTRQDAIKVQQYFQQVGAEIMLTNDTFHKRKCYRTVWPEPPSLSFIHKPPAAEESLSHGTQRDQEENEALDVERALEEIHSMGVESATRSPQQSPSASFSEEQECRHEEIEKWKKEAFLQQAEVTRLRQEMEQLKRECLNAQQSRSAMEEQLQKRDKEIEELQILLTNAEEKYEGLKEEYREARAIWDEKLSQSSQESSDQSARTHELLEKVRGLEKTKEELQDALTRQEHQYRQRIQERQALHEDLEKRLDETSRQLEEEKSRLSELRTRLEQLEKEKDGLQVRLKEEMDRAELWRMKCQEIQRHFSEVETKSREWQLKNEELMSRLEEWDRLKASYAEKLRIQEEEEQQWRKKERELEHQRLQAELALRSERDLRLKAEEKLRDFEAHKARYATDLEIQERQARQWELKALELEKKIEEIHKAHETERALLEDKIRYYEQRERELETTRRQLREMTQQIEQREAIQKRNYMVNQLVEKEARLKRLIEDQERVEAEIRDREESMRRILAEQEALEKEIIEHRQMERYLLEQLKKDKGPKTRGLRVGNGSAGRMLEEKTAEGESYDRNDIK